MAFLGSLFVTTLTYIIPSIWGLKVVSVNCCQKILDVFLIIFGIFAFIF